MAFQVLQALQPVYPGTRSAGMMAREISAYRVIKIESRHHCPTWRPRALSLRRGSKTSKLRIVGSGRHTLPQKLLHAYQSLQRFAKTEAAYFEYSTWSLRARVPDFRCKTRRGQCIQRTQNVTEYCHCFLHSRHSRDFSGSTRTPEPRYRPLDFCRLGFDSPVRGR